MKKRLDITAAFREGWELFKLAPSALLGASAIAFLGGALTSGILAPPLLGGLLLMIRRIDRDDPRPPSAMEVLLGFSNFLQPLLVGLGFLVPMALGWAFLHMPWLAPLAVLPGIVLLPALCWALFLVVYRGETALDAYQFVFRYIFRADMAATYAAMLLPALIACSGAAVFGAGAIVTAPLGLCIAHRVYVRAFEDEPEVEVVFE